MKRPSFGILGLLPPLALLFVLALNACASAPTAAPTTALAPTTAAGPTAAGSGTTAPVAPTAAKPAASPAAAAPKYGGTLNLAMNGDVTTFDDYYQGGPGVTFWNQGQQLIGGDWAKGRAGGFGTNDTDWGTSYNDLAAVETGYLAQSWTMNVDAAANQAVMVFQIRQGIHYAVNPTAGADASKLVNGREMTADDVVASISEGVNDKRGWTYRQYPALRGVTTAAKTGPWEVTVKAPAAELVTIWHGIGKTQRIYPAEIATKNIDTSKWQNQVTTGPFMLTGYMQGSTITLSKNPNYWMKDPIGPGKGNQLPYLDGVQFYIITDPSTRTTAFRTGKIDQLPGMNWEDAAQIQKEFPQMPSADGEYSALVPMYIRTDHAPYNNVKVRQALIMATDFNALKQSLNGGKGIIITWPYEVYKGYEDLYVDVDGSPTIKDIYTYNPTKAKQMLADAGYPNGFKSSIMYASNSIDQSYYEAVASMWAKIGVTLALDAKDLPTLTNNVNGGAYNDLVASPGKGPASVYYSGTTLGGTPGTVNPCYIDDSTINDYLTKLRTTFFTDPKASHATAKQMATYAVEQAFVVPRPAYRTVTFWWPWLKNYSGEVSVGYIFGQNWSQWVWIDQDLKKTMGH